MCPPLVTAASSEHRKRTTRAISSGLTHVSKSASGIEARLAGVSITDGRIAFVRTPSPAYSACSTSTSASTAALPVT
jgi:hypothetical protein